MFKKSLSFLVFVLLVFSGCGGGSSDETEATSSLKVPDLQDSSLHLLEINKESLAIRFVNRGGDVTSCTISPSLPSGLEIDDKCNISGTPTVLTNPTTYTVEGSNSAGSSISTIKLEVISYAETTVQLKGTIVYDHVPFSLNGGLDYANTTQKKVRGAVVKIIDASGNALATTTTDANGAYDVTVTGTSVKVRVYAQMYKAVQNGEASWNFQVKDNTDSSSLYVMEGSLAYLGTSSTQTRNLRAPSGWGGSSYSGSRVAAPFAILDVVYKAVDKIKTAQSDAVFPALDIFWSKNNIAATGDINLGQITTSHFNGTSLFILGKENSDTDEYDSAVVAHEWSHYYEAMFSRSDSIGGQHGEGDMLDIRLAFGEGFGTAVGCMIIDSSLYRDSLGDRQSRLAVSEDLEAGGSRSNPGWYSEASIYSILYDIYDAHNDAGDTLSLGFTPIHKVLIDAQKNTAAFTSIFSFITALKAVAPGNDTAIDAITSNESIAPINDIYGTGRTNRGTQNANPLYSNLTVGGSVNIVTNYSAISNSSGYVVTERGRSNELGIYNFVKFTIPSTGSYTFNISQVGGRGTPDPDFYIYKSGSKIEIGRAIAGGTTDRLTTTLSAGTYRMAVIVYNQNSGNTFNITLN
jgi:hypothetical protein